MLVLLVTLLFAVLLLCLLLFLLGPSGDLLDGFQHLVLVHYCVACIVFLLFVRRGRVGEGLPRQIEAQLLQLRSLSLRVLARGDTILI
jgi:hypothetical protein